MSNTELTINDINDIIDSFSKTVDKKSIFEFENNYADYGMCKDNSLITLKPVKLTTEQLQTKYARYCSSVNPNDENFVATFEEYVKGYNDLWEKREKEELERKKKLEELQRIEEEKYKQSLLIEAEKLRIEREKFRQLRVERVKREYEEIFGKTTEPVSKPVKIEVYSPKTNRTFGEIND